MIPDQILDYVLINAVVMTVAFVFSSYILFLRYGLPVYHLMGFYQVYFFLGFVFRPWELYLTGESTLWYNIGNTPDGPSLLWTTAVVLLAHFSVLAGFIVTNPRFGPVAALRPINFEVGNPTGFAIVLTVCLVLGCYGSYTLFGTGLDTTQAVAFAVERDARGALTTTDVSGYQTILAELLTITLIILFAVRRTRRLSVALILAFIAYRSVAGAARNAFVAVALGVIFILLINARRRLPSIRVVVYGLVLLAFFNVVGSDRLALKKVIAGDQTVSELVGNYFTADSKPAVTANMQEFDVLAAILDVVPARSGYSYGTQYLRILVWPIPRQLWPEKPVYTSSIDLNNYGDFRNLSTTMFADNYMTFGVPAEIIICFLISLWLNRLYQRAVDRPTPLRLMFYFCVIIYLPVLFRDGPVQAAYYYISLGLGALILCRGGNLQMGRDR